MPELRYAVVLPDPGLRVQAQVATLSEARIVALALEYSRPIGLYLQADIYDMETCEVMERSEWLQKGRTG